MKTLIHLPIDPYRGRIFQVACWLSRHGGRTDEILSKNLATEVRRYLASLIVSGVDPAAASAQADQFRADVLARLIEIRTANASRPACGVVPRTIRGAA